MSINRDLVDSIKKKFSEISSADLLQVAQSTGQQWSVEAIAAARELLLDRAEGRAEEPEFPKDLNPARTCDGFMDLVDVAGGAGIVGLGASLGPWEALMALKALPPFLPSAFDGQDAPAHRGEMPESVPEDDTSEVAECLGCGGIIPVGESTCIRCGWSYGASSD